MDFDSRNEQIGYWNQMAVFACQRARALEDEWYELVEDHAGMVGDRPRPAVRLVDSSDSQPVSSSPAQQDTPEVVPVVSLEQVRSVLGQLSCQGHTVKVRELIEQAGGDRLSVVDPSKYGWLLAQAEMIADA